MARLIAVSGVGGKLPASFVVEDAGRRLLFDIGEGPTPGVRPNLDGIGRVDAVFISHAHEDHAAALDLHRGIGSPPVYATAATWESLSSAPVPRALRRVIPEHGRFDAEGFSLLVGRNGHSPGGVWYHLAAGGGLNYMGDWSRESALLPFDEPPPADLLVTDASYGDRDESLAGQIRALVAASSEGAVLPVPPDGRGPEMAVRLLQEGLPVRLCPRIAAEAERGPYRESGVTCTALTNSTILRRFPESCNAREVIVAVDASAESGLSSALASREDFRFIFTGHVAPGTRGRALLDAGRASWLAWNAHPRRSDNVALALNTRARRVVAAFCFREDAAVLDAELEGLVSWNPLIDF